MKLKPYSKSQLWGIISLIAVIILIFIIYLIVDKKSIDNRQVILTDVTEEWMKSSPSAQNNSPNSPPPSEIQGGSIPSSYDAQDIAYAPSPFDPNSASFETLIANGLSTSSAKRIIAYRNKGGTFYQKEKLKNFGIDDATFSKIEPYLTLPKNKSSNYSNNYSSDKYSNNYSPQPEPNDLDINAATQEELMRFKGIGPGFSKRIIEYRTKLGGFLNVEQLKEVYGLPDTVYNHIKDKLVVKTAINKININTATFEQLSDHPYIRKFMAEKIIKFRDDIKEFKSIQDLRQIPLINEEKYRKIVPYISL